MQDKNAHIAIYNKLGNVIESKLRKDIDKEKDILKTVNVLVINDKNKLFTVKAKDALWRNKFGGSCATLLRLNETKEKAANRVLQKELNLTGQPIFLAEKYYNFNGIKRFLSVFMLKTNKIPIINSDDFINGCFMSIEEIKGLINKDLTMPTLNSAIKILENKK